MEALILSLSHTLSLSHLRLEFGSAQHPRHGEQDGCFLLAKTVVVVEFVPEKLKKKIYRIKRKKNACWLPKTVVVVEFVPDYNVV